MIDALPQLVNIKRGWHAVEFGRAQLQEVGARYDRQPARIKERAILIRINKLYRPLMERAELYDATRGVWKVDAKRASQVELAFAVYDGIVREVYEVQGWLGAGSTFLTRKPQGERLAGRYEFVGRVAPDKVRRRYVNRDVGDYFKGGSRNPVRYVNV